MASVQRASRIAARAEVTQNRIAAVSPRISRRARLRPAAGILDARGCFVAVSASMAQAIGRPPVRLCGKSVFDIVHPDDARRVRAAFALAWSKGSARKVRCRFKPGDGGWRWIEATVDVVARQHGGADAILHARYIAPARQPFPQAVPADAGLHAAAFGWDLDCRVTSWSAGAEHLFGYAATEMFAPGGLAAIALHGGEIDFAKLRAEMIAARCGVSHTARAVTKGGRIVTCEWHHAPVLDARGSPIGFASTAADAASGIRDKHLRRASLTDPVTGVASSNLFMDRLERTIADSARSRFGVGLFLIDLDDFASMNKAFGYRAGDALLRTVAERLAGCLRDADSLARLGGDKFVVLLPRVGGSAGACAIAQRALDCFAEPFLVGADRYVQTASVGIALYPDDARDADSLVRCADSAMKRAKDLGCDSYQFCSPSSSASDRLSLERALRTAVERGELEVHFQPQVDLRTGTVIGAEALVRWRHPSRGLLNPAEFLPAAEETGLIIPIGAWVLRTACAAMRSWNDAGISLARLTVNVSGRELRRRMVDDVAKVLCDTNIDPDSLELDLTETAALRSSESNPHLLDELRSFGVRLAIDGLGVGWSSFGFLQRIPVDVLKIDRTLMEDCLTSRVSAAIVRAVVAMAHDVGIEAAAEGVQTSAQADFLAEIGCDVAQGFLYGPALPPAEFAALLVARRTLPIAREM